jgi:hypothetical protein
LLHLTDAATIKLSYRLKITGPDVARIRYKYGFYFSDDSD